MATETKTTVTRTRRVAFTGAPAEFSVEFTLPSGEKVTIGPHTNWPGATITKALQYGITQLYQDGLARGKAEGPATDDDAKELIARFESGDWSSARGSGDGRPTMESVARAIVRAKYPKLKASEDEFKSKVVALLDESADPARFAKVKAEYDRQFAAWEAARAVDVDI